MLQAGLDIIEHMPDGMPQRNFHFHGVWELSEREQGAHSKLRSLEAFEKPLAVLAEACSRPPLYLVHYLLESTLL